ncbi:hypothetical protein DM45_3373 [Burkholderia mallei]|nr:hypothetical protein DM45_3373 [Burkholderia mallei]KOT23218.1 hypothetical protein DM52_2555 [Burkholderia mallei]
MPWKVFAQRVRVIGTESSFIVEAAERAAIKEKATAEATAKAAAEARPETTAAQRKRRAHKHREGGAAAPAHQRRLHVRSRAPGGSTPSRCIATSSGSVISRNRIVYALPISRRSDAYVSARPTGSVFVSGVWSIHVRLNSPIDSVSTASAPATMPGRRFGSTIVAKRVANDAPRLAAPSSSVRRSARAATAATARTMNGSVNTTWPTTMNHRLVRNAAKPP